MWGISLGERSELGPVYMYLVFDFFRQIYVPAQLVDFLPSFGGSVGVKPPFAAPLNQVQAAGGSQSENSAFLFSVLGCHYNCHCNCYLV